ncbi:hypothetical protein ACU610_22230 [Geodermatophilus sp. URMC 61]|uniref:hypothetical protein n=1 Tax=Geodermatophilus sp. URMC 61 TaxID=3423411 RepID=UPI00406D0645
MLTLLGLLGPLVGYAGLAWAGVIGRWLVAALVASATLPFAPLPHAAFAAVGAVPAVVVGLRMVHRHRAGSAVPV